MKVHQLLEGNFRGHGYDIGNHPTSRDYGLAHLYNTVIPNLSRIFKIPVANFKVQSDHGFGWHEGRQNARPYSIEKCMMRVILRKKGLNVELISKMLPKSLKNELSKVLMDVGVSDAEVHPEMKDDFGETIRYTLIDMKFEAKYPEQWLKWDKERYSLR